MRPTSSIEAAISLIEDDVSSAAAARSVAFPATPTIERDISSIAAAVSLTADVSDSVSRDTFLVLVAISATEVAISLSGRGHSWPSGHRSNRDGGLLAEARFGDRRREADGVGGHLLNRRRHSFIEETSSSAEPVTDSACAGRLDERGADSSISVSASSRLRICFWAPSATSSAIRATLPPTASSARRGREPRGIEGRGVEPFEPLAGAVGLFDAPSFSRVQAAINGSAKFNTGRA